MQSTKKRPIVLSIAGLDPSAGAGILADTKTFENLGVYGFAICTSITYQTDKEMKGLSWVSEKKIKKQLYPIFKAYKVEVVKIGLIKNLKTLNNIIDFLLFVNPTIKIIWDPILKASTGFNFHKKIHKKLLKEILQKCFLITPNWNEIVLLSNQKDAMDGATFLSAYCAIYLKGGHSIETPGVDCLFYENKLEIYHPEKITTWEKHGTGCVLSSAITANLALNYTIEKSCNLAKKYTLDFLLSNETLLGYHTNFNTK